jgi:hypothetical protein
VKTGQKNWRSKKTILAFATATVNYLTTRLGLKKPINCFGLEILCRFICVRVISIFTPPAVRGKYLSSRNSPFHTDGQDSLGQGQGCISEKLRLFMPQPVSAGFF